MGNGSHFEHDEKHFANLELDFVEKRICRSLFVM